MPEQKKQKIIKVAELFAGVGGFRIGLDRASKKSSIKFKTVWSNQWEPSTIKQHASELYVKKFGRDNHSNIDIAEEVKNGSVPDHDLLVGGFPCQDYSVARTLSQAAGLNGKKGILWWEIYKILKSKKEKKKPVKYIFLENVDRLLKSPAKQRGRDFAIMLACLAELGYAVEWRVINAAEYGFPQRRRRTYILGYFKGTAPYKNLENNLEGDKIGARGIFEKEGVMAQAFKIIPPGNIKQGKLDKDIKKISNSFNVSPVGAKSPFENSGLMFNGIYYTSKTKPLYNGKHTTLADIVLPLNEVGKEFFIKMGDIKQWKYLKGAKNQPRKSKSGFEFVYTEGSMPFPDPINKPSRTIVTSEGGSTPSRFKHVIEQDGVLRRLTPKELEKLCGFDEDHTAGESDVKRAFFMGNALVVGVIEKIGKTLLENIS